MSEPRFTTGNTRDAKCDRCGAETTEHESRGMYRSGPTWDLTSHPSPCGLPCFAAGVSGRAYRERRIHGHKDFPCPNCEPADARSQSLVKELAKSPTTIKPRPARSGDEGEV